MGTCGCQACSALAPKGEDMAKKPIIAMINQQSWLEPVGDTLQRWVDQAYTASGATGQRIENILSGTWLGHPLHPALTDVPIGSFTLVATFDGLEAAAGGRTFARAADATLTVGLAAALASAVSGLSDWHYTTDEPRRVGLVHGLLNLGATALYTGSLIARLSGARGWGRGLGFLGYGVVTLAAYLGGELVYHERIGVDHAPEDAPTEFVAVLDDVDLKEGQPRRVVAQGIPVMLVRQSGRIYALAEHCAHLGGPLSEGQLKDGYTICPWHGSRFALADGRVLDGPATFDQPAYQTRVRNGQIEVGPAYDPAQHEAPRNGEQAPIAAAG